MVSLLIVGAVVVAGIGWALRGRSPGWGNALLITGCLSCLGVAGWQVRDTLFSADTRTPNRAHTVVGFFLASQAQRETAGQRGTVVLTIPPTSVLDAETAESYVNLFRGPLLRGHPELQVEVATLEAPAKEIKSGIMPLHAFKEVIAKHPNALAFVCFAGLPSGMETLFPADQTKFPPILAFDPAGTTNWASALAQRRLSCVIVPRPDVNPETAKGISGLPGEIFGRLYYLATPETADQIAKTVAANPGKS